MSPAERRRLTLATILTIVALPALWLMQRDDTAPGSPSVAAVGAPVPGNAADGDTVDTEPPPPAYLEGPNTTAPLAPDTSLVIATSQESAGERLTGTAGYRRADDTFGAGACQVHGAPIGQVLTVRNVDNDRTATCYNLSTARSPSGEIAILEMSVLLQIADLVDAPLPVEITW